MINSSPPGAEILLNGKKSGKTPKSFLGLESSRNYFIVLKKAGYKPFFKGLKLSGGEQVKIMAKLEQKSASGTAAHAGSGSGFLIANTTPWARVFIDGKDTGLSTPIPANKKLALDAGTHKVTFKTQTGKTLNISVKIVAGKTAKVIKKFP